MTGQVWTPARAVASRTTTPPANPLLEHRTPTPFDAGRWDSCRDARELWCLESAGARFSSVVGGDNKSMGKRFLLPAMLVVALFPLAASGQQRQVEDGFVSSFDGTKISYSFFAPAVRPAPIVFFTHGWGGHREREDTGWVATMLDAGYAVLTWDARGFGDSGGEANVDSQEFEVKDVQALIDFAATRPEVALDRSGDPRMGMSGGSYGGGIQLMTASVDARVDAIVPEIAWNDLVQSLLPGGVVKFGWGSLLYASGNASATSEGLDSPAGPQTGALAPQIHQAFAESTGTNTWSDETIRWFDARSPKLYLRGLRAPTLIVQGVSDTLFNATQGITNYETIRALGVPAKLLLFCGGHTVNAAGTSCNPADASDRIDRRAIAWFNHYLRDMPPATGPQVEYQVQDGTFNAVEMLPMRKRIGSGAGRIVHATAPTSGVVTAPQPSRDGVRIPVNARPGDTLLGVPQATIAVSGIGQDASYFFKLLDIDGSGKATVIDDQSTALKIAGFAGRAPTTRTIDLAAVSWTVQQGHSVMLEVSPSSNDHAASRFPSATDVDLRVSIPVLTPAGARSAAARAPGAADPRPVRPAPAPTPLPATGVGSPGLAVALLIASAGLARAVRSR